jgi:hypothetical protein
MLAKLWQLLSAGEVVNGDFDARLEQRSINYLIQWMMILSVQSEETKADKF